MKKDLTEIVVILDKSGSMEFQTDETVSAFNKFIKEQQKQTGTAAVTLVLFDNDYYIVYSGKPLNEVPKLTRSVYKGEGMGSTALLDAVGRTIDEVGKRLSEMAEDQRPEHVLFMVLTDGMENASKTFKLDQIKEKVEHQKGTYKWEFIFMGATLDAFHGGSAAFGSSSKNYAGQPVRAMFGVMCCAASNFRNSGGDSKSTQDLVDKAATKGK